MFSVWLNGRRLGDFFKASFIQHLMGWRKWAPRPRVPAGGARILDGDLYVWLRAPRRPN